MVKRIASILLYVAIWGIIVAYIVQASMLVTHHRQHQTIEHVNINIVDSTGSGQLITSKRVREHLIAEGIGTMGVLIDSVDVRAIRNMIIRNGFVDNVDVYASYSGILHINISQRKPLFRLMTNRHNAYVTHDGFIFGSPEQSSLYVPVVTGQYNPPFGKNFEGTTAMARDIIRKQYNDPIRLLAQRLTPIKAQRRHWQERRREIRDSSIGRRWFGNKAAYAAKQKAWRAERKRLLRYCDGMLRDCQRAKEQVEKQQRAVALRGKAMEQRLDDFMRLIKLVETISNHDFWAAEVVQIDITENSLGRICVELVPRSGNHRIIFGELQNEAAKLERLHNFYHTVLGTVGWQHYASIDVSYSDRVICKNIED